MRCGFCNEEYELGPKTSRPAGFHTFEDGEYAYWRHTGSSERHGLLLDAQAIVQRDLLARMPEAMTTGRAHQKLMRREDLAPLRRLFR